MSGSDLIPISFLESPRNQSGLTRGRARARRGALDTGDRRQDWNTSPIHGSNWYARGRSWMDIIARWLR